MNKFPIYIIITLFFAYILINNLLKYYQIFQLPYQKEFFVTTMPNTRPLTPYDDELLADTINSSEIENNQTKNNMKHIDNQISKQIQNNPEQNDNHISQQIQNNLKQTANQRCEQIQNNLNQNDNHISEQIHNNLKQIDNHKSEHIQNHQKQNNNLKQNDNQKQNNNQISEQLPNNSKKNNNHICDQLQNNQNQDIIINVKPIKIQFEHVFDNYPDRLPTNFDQQSQIKKSKNDHFLQSQIHPLFPQLIELPAIQLIKSSSNQNKQTLSIKDEKLNLNNTINNLMQQNENLKNEINQIKIQMKKNLSQNVDNYSVYPHINSVTSQQLSPYLSTYSPFPNETMSNYFNVSGNTVVNSILPKFQDEMFYNGRYYIPKYSLINEEAQVRKIKD